MNMVRRAAELRAAVSGARSSGMSIGLVPTMGALHKGHGALIDRARAECGYVVVSIFVNPIQFDRKEDYERYARTLPADLEFCRERGVDLVFTPDADEIYPGPQRVFVDAPALTEFLCGAYRPGHFRGVATVVTKLFNLVQPDRAYFGEKDAQQLAIVQALAADLNMPVSIVPVPTVRESDGLAISSRNVRLNPAERKSAAALYRALRLAADCVSAGAGPDEAKEAALALLSKEPGVRVEYFEIVDPEQMRPVEAIRGPVRIAAAVWAGATRLIDNLLPAWLRNSTRFLKAYPMATYCQLAAKLLRDAATFFRNVGAQNESLKEQMNDNASIYDQVADLVEKTPGRDRHGRRQGERATAEGLTRSRCPSSISELLLRGHDMSRRGWRGRQSARSWRWSWTKFESRLDVASPNALRQRAW